MHIYFSGIGGSGLSALAHLCLDVGYTVSGSELEESKNTKELQKRGAGITFHQDNSSFMSNLHQQTPVDWLVISAAIEPRHPEKLFATANNIKTTKRDGLINYILTEKNLQLIAISGTHGKTTTTAMIVWLFKQLNLPVSYAIGSNLAFGNSGGYAAGSEYFVLEADEYDKNMLKFHPELAVIPCLDYDHPDTYPTPKDYLQAFDQFVNQSRLTITWESTAKKLADSEKVFALPEDRNLLLVDLPGLHNRRNAWLAATSVERLDLAGTTVPEWKELLKLFDNFPGTERRFEKLADNLYSDYAHHPEEIAATLQLAREVTQDIVVIYQPHQNIRQHNLKGHYNECFKGAKAVYWLPTYLSREDPKLAILSSKELTPKTDGVEFFEANMDEQLVQAVKRHMATKQSVIIMGAGSIDGWAREAFI